jgi:hypothetical protein
MLSRSLLCLLLLAPLAHADTTVEFTVSAGKLDRKNEPVCVPLLLPKKAEESDLVSIRNDKDREIAVGQLAPPSLTTLAVKQNKDTRRLDLHFVLPELKADAVINLKAIISPRKEKADYTETYQWVTLNPGETELRFESGPRKVRGVLRYIHPKLDESSTEKRVNTFKVFHHVYDPAGTLLVTKGAGGHFTHHRGLFYGFAKTG